MTKPWNWNNINSEYWLTPSPDMYYFLHRWKSTQRNKILDLGCGIGRHAFLFSENGFDVTAFDLSPSAIEKIEIQNEERKLKITTCIGDIKSLPFDEGEFDAIVAYHSIYHLDTISMNEIVARLATILAPEGEIYLSLISKSTYSYTAGECTVVDDNVRLKLEEDGSVLPHYFVNHDDIRNLFSAYFDFVNIRHVEDFTEQGSSWHYFVHMKLKNRANGQLK